MNLFRKIKNLLIILIFVNAQASIDPFDSLNEIDLKTNNNITDPFDSLNRITITNSIEFEKKAQNDENKLTDIAENENRNENITQTTQQTTQQNNDDEYDEQKQIIDVVTSIGNKVSNGNPDLENIAYGFASTELNKLTNDYLENTYYGAKSEFAINFNKQTKLGGSAKFLFPYTFEDFTNTFFTQIGAINNNKRWITHFGLGWRWFPEAQDEDYDGNLMFGLNSVVDYDVTRGHMRYSIGTEIAYDNFELIGNIYKRITDYKDSKDFKKPLDFIQERPANGWDVKLKYFLLPDYIKLAVVLGLQKWQGEKVGVFGEENLEKTPLIYQAGLEYTPFPLITLGVLHNQSTKNNSTNFNLKFNIPFAAEELKNSLKPSYVQKNNLKFKRNDFIDRDYTMPLEYRSKPGKFNIFYCGKSGDTHCFSFKDGFGEVAKNLAVKIVPTDSCVVLDNSGNYKTDNSGKITAYVMDSCTPKTTLNVTAGDTTEQFFITIGNVQFTLTAEPGKIERSETSKLILRGDKLSSGLGVEWKVEGKGSIIKSNNAINESGVATASYQPAVDMEAGEKATVIATVNGLEFKQDIGILIYGNNPLIAIPTTIGNKELSVLTYKNLRPGTEVNWLVDSIENAYLSLEKEIQDQSIKPNQLVTKVPDNGEVIVYLHGLKKSRVVRVYAKNSDPFVPQKFLDIEVKNYTASLRLLPPKENDDTIDYLTDFEIEASNLKPGTKVTWRSKNSNISPKITETIVNDNGTTIGEFTSLRDSKVTNLEILAEYDESSVVRESVAKSINLFKYNLRFSISKPLLTDKDSFTATLTGGKAGQSVLWDITGDGVFVKKDDKFNDNGIATAVIENRAPFTNKIIITAKDVFLDKIFNEEISMQIT
ncbi:hypothetical protein CFT12S00416_08015, partial [Campylobacter fetus subsp. testudinum]|uniref:inverse autotransporter beta domain-containing protein n=2 Tax=Campylobacter fetus TaxID=196 RepID=UPI00081D62D5